MGSFWSGGAELVDTSPMRKLDILTGCFVGSLAIGIGGCADQSGGSADGSKNVGVTEAQNLGAARTTFETAEDPPFNAGTRFAAGQLAESQNQPDLALEQYREAIKIDPKHQQSLYRLGVLNTQTKQYPAAIEAWKQYVKVTNGNPTAYSNLAFCLEISGKGSEAEAAYKSGIKKDPKNEPCRVNYGLFLARTGREKEAIEQLSAVLPPAKVHYNLASVYETVGRADEARAQYRKALEVDPEFWEARSRLSRLD